MNTFIDRRLHAMKPATPTIVVTLPASAPVKLCAVILAGQPYTRVWDDHSTVHFEGDVDARLAASRFLEGEG